MAQKTEIIEVDGEAGIALPEDLLARWGVDEGAELFLTEIENGYLLSPKKPQESQ